MRNEIADYLSAGWALCKIKPGEKGAFETGWSTREGAHVGQRRDLLEDWTGGVGLLHAYSGTCAIDIDDMKRAVPAFAAHGIDLPGLLRAAGSVVWWRGDPTRLKLLYRLTEPLITVARPQHGFELRCASQAGTSMQDVLPPSIHPSGTPYSWIRGDWRDPPPLPPELRKAWPHAKAWWPEQTLVQRAAPTGGSSLTAAAMVGAPLVAAEGQRNQFLSDALFGYLKRGGNYEESLEWLRALNIDKCDPPEEDDKLFKIWRNKAGIEPDPIVIAPPPGALPGTEPLVIAVKPDLPFGYEWDGDWIYHVDGGTPPVRTKVSGRPLWVERILRTRNLDGTEVRTLEVMTHEGAHQLPYDHLISKTEASLGHIGINVIEEAAKRVRRYLVRGKELCEEKGKIVDTYGTFGWHGESFLVGSTLYTPHKAPTTVALTPALMPLAAEMRPALHGTLADWRSAMQDLITKDNMPQAFGFLMGMAAPLMKLSGERGGMFSLLGESGQGKSTVQNALCTVWGDPQAFHTRADDTVNARMIKLSYLSNLPMVAEELTKMEPGELSNLAYSVSEGRDKERATQEGALRLNVGQWHTVVVSSSNRSLLDAILLADGDAAAYRILEDTVTLPKGSKASEGARIMRALAANQGHAGHVFAQYIVDHRERLGEYITATAHSLADEVSATTKERIRINMLACALVAGAVLKAAGILPINFRDFREYGLTVLRRNVGSQADSAVSFDDVLQGFIDANQAGVLRMANGSPTNVTSIQGRTTPLIMRFDLPDNELTVNRTALHKHVVDRKQNWNAFKEWLDTRGYLKRENRFVLSKGSGLPSSPQVRVLVLDNVRMGAFDAIEPSLTTAAIV